ncbi:MAG: hypothetical protein OEX74_09915 [Gammaproteobacteria bacterium]|nr:hypothetical protein [Gammaproteobacteria bacterium]
MTGMHRLLALLLALTHTAVGAQVEPPQSDAPEARPTVIGEIVLEKSDVFDLSNPEENNALYRLANRLHIITHDEVIKEQLLLQSGSTFSARLVSESERILRQNRYLYDAHIRPTQRADGTVDLTVVTRDVWSLGPDLSASRSGGENRSQIGLEEINLLGRGQTVRFNHEEDENRRSNSLEFFDRHVARSRVSAYLKAADNSDGKSNQVSVVRPFYALDSRWSAGGHALDDDRRSALYFLGEEAAEYQHARRYSSLFGGWSKGLRNGFATRWTAGITRDENQFTQVADPELPALLPENRELVYPFVAVEIVEDDFQTSRNRDQIGKTEDFFTGRYLSASLGWADKSLGSDRDALIYAASVRRGYGSLAENALLLSASTGGRVESGHTANALLNVDARYYRTQSAKRLFFTTISASAGRELDLDNPLELGGNNGLRGYPLRYQSGDTRLLLTVEQRYFTDWYPFRLARIGAAVFADVGRVWGENPLGNDDQGWLTDIGFGLRIAPTRGSSGKTVHIDIAFPLNGDESIDDVQFLLEAKRGF